MNILPWYQFAAFLDITDELRFMNSHAPLFWERVFSPKGLDIGAMDTIACSNQGEQLIPDTSAQSSQYLFRDSRFNMVPPLFLARSKWSANNIPSSVLKTLSILPEFREDNLRDTTQSSGMQMSKVLMFLLSNNHISRSIEDRLSIPMYLGNKIFLGFDKLIPELLRACSDLQCKQLLCCGGATSEALLEKTFQCALRAEDVEVCRILLDYGVDPNKQGFIWTPSYGIQTPLQHALGRNNAEIASILLKAGAHAIGCLEPAVESGMVDMVNILLAAGAGADTQDSDSALRSAVRKQDIAMAQTLISAGADLASGDEYGSTALHLASTNPEMVKMLLHAGADINAVADSNFSVVQAFVHMGHDEALQILLDAGPDVFGDAIEIAVHNGDADIIRNLLKAVADINACFMASRRTALTAAVENENISIVKLLLDAGAVANGCTLDHASSYDYIQEDSDGGTVCYGKNYTPLQAASFHKDTRVAKILIEAGANIDMDCACDNFSQSMKWNGESLNDRAFYGTAVQIAAQQGNLELVKLLYHAGATFNAPAHPLGGRTALQAAVENEDHKMIELILAAGADVNGPPAKYGGITALAAAIMSKDSNLVLLMVREGVSFKKSSARRSEVTPLAAAAATGDVEFVRDRLFEGADPVDSAALQAAVANGHIDLVRILLSARAKSDNPRGKKYGAQALIQAAKDRNIELVGILLASKIDPNVGPGRYGMVTYCPKTRKWLRARFMESPWYIALDSGNIRIVQTFLDAGADPSEFFQDSSISYPECCGSCLLVVAVQNSLPMMQLLLDAGADVNVDLGPEAPDSNTIIGYAAHHGQVDSIRLLLKAGAHPDIPPIGEDQSSALQAAAMSGSEQIIDILLQAGADVNVPPSPYGGVTALQAAAIQGYLRIARLLIEAGADVNAAAAEEEGRTALAGAAEHGRVDMLQYLLNNGASIDGAPGRAQYESAMHYAAKNGHLSACNLLSSHHRRLHGSS